MKTAFQYIRISDKEQSNFSIEGQERANRQYAEKHGIIITGTFIDDGRSARDFDRPEWRKLEAAMRQKRDRVDYLIVMKYDRLIRNAAQGLAFIENLEQVMNVKLLSVMENFFIDPHSPYFFKMRADLLVQGEFERRVIADRTKFGVWSARSAGRFIGMAPFAYRNTRDDQNKPTITIEPEKRKIVEDMFRDLLAGLTLHEVGLRARANGLTRTGNDAIKRILTNPIYAGLIPTPTYKDEYGKLVKGLHEAIISEDTFWQAQAVLKNRISPQVKALLSPVMPLRGVLYCQSCGHLLTGGMSKGRNKHYPYYRCLSCKGENYNATKSEGEFLQVLQDLSLAPDFVDEVLQAVEVEMDNRLKQDSLQLKACAHEAELIEKKIHQLEEKHITDQIDLATYIKWKGTYAGQLAEAQAKIKRHSADQDEVWKLYEKNLDKLTDMAHIWNTAGLLEKQEMVRGIFPGCLIKADVGYRTPLLNSLFHHKGNNISMLAIQQERGPRSKATRFPVGTRDGT